MCHATSGIYGSVFDVNTRRAQQKIFLSQASGIWYSSGRDIDINIIGDEMPLLNARIIKFETNFYLTSKDILMKVL
jgi:hypothetical protein